MSTKLICVVNDTIPKNSNLHSEHGVSFWIETDHGTVLFDTGQTASVLSHNLETLGLSAKDIDRVALSHAHDDHTGGLGVLIANQKSIPLYANQDLFTPRYSLRNNEYKEIGIPLTKSELCKHFFFHLNNAPQEIYPNLWTTGKIEERPEKVGGSAHHFMKIKADLQPDTYSDDMSLVLKTEQGLILICGCCHAGLINTLYHVENTFQKKVMHVIGGTHLGPFKTHELNHVIDIIQKKFPNCQFHLNHCTSSNAINRMQEGLGDQVEGYLPGTWLEF